MKIKVTIFEDNKSLRESLRQLIDNAEGMCCTGAFPDANKLARRMQLTNPDVVMMDINMPGVSGIKAVQLVKEKFPQVQIMMQRFLKTMIKYLQPSVRGRRDANFTAALK